MIRSIFVLSLFILSKISNLLAQDTLLPKKPIFANAVVKYHYDRFFIPEENTELRDELLGMHSHAIEARLAINTDGKRLWQQRFHYPTYGLGYYQTLWEADEYFGFPGAVFMFLNGPFIGSKRTTFSWNYDMSIGVGFGFKTYDPITNPYNNIIGSPVSIYLNFRTEVQAQISDRFTASLGLGVTHFSNGRTKTPNKGANLLGGDVGLNYHFHASKKDLYDTESFRPKLINNAIPEFKAFAEYYLVASAGWRQSSEHYDENVNYLTSSLAFDVARHYNWLGKYSIGLDMFYDEGVSVDVPGSTSSDYIDFGIHIGHELIIQRISFVTQLGTYLTNNAEKGTIWTRFSLRYDITKNLHIRGGLKTLNGAKADFSEFGIGYSIYGKNYRTLVPQHNH